MNAWDNPRTLVRPPRLYLASIIAGIALEFIHPLGLRDMLDDATLLTSGLALSTTGLVIMIYAMRQFAAAGTNVPTILPARALVTNGLYTISRNPIYVGMTLLYGGLALMAGSLWCLILLPAVLLIMRFGVIAREETYLEHKFGEEYRRYKSNVGRWI